MSSWGHGHNKRTLMLCRRYAADVIGGVGASGNIFMILFTITMLLFFRVSVISSFVCFLSVISVNFIYMCFFISRRRLEVGQWWDTVCWMMTFVYVWGICPPTDGSIWKDCYSLLCALTCVKRGWKMNKLSTGLNRVYKLEVYYFLFTFLMPDPEDNRL